MTAPARSDLRDPTPAEGVALPSNMIGDSFHIAANSQKTFKPTGTPVVFFDVLSRDGQRIGIANAILEPKADSVRGVGPVCVTLKAEYSDPEFLTQVADVLVDFAFSSGIPEVLIVVPGSHATSVDACCRLDPISSTETLLDSGIPELTYVYRR